MKKRFKKILLFSIMIICGLYYMLKGTFLELGDINIRGASISLTDKDTVMNTTYANANLEVLLINKDHGLSRNYVPENLTIPNIPFSDGLDSEEKHVAGIIAKPLEELVSTAKEEGITLFGNSGYRSYKSQKNIYSSRIKSQGKKLADAYVAKPGFSEHQTGLCIDITNKDRYFTEGTREAKWLAENCYRFGFIIRYPKEKKSITNIEHEPWHIRYVGKEAAKYIYDRGITLEEYLNK